jgi:hypothetical protein
MTQRGESGLDMGAHPLLVKVQTGLRFVDQSAFGLECQKIGECLLVNAFGTRIGFRWEIDFCAVYPEQAVGESIRKG